LIEATPECNISWGPLADLPPLKKWWREKVVLLGDSAHAMLPNLGQGGAAALSDAWSLAQCLERHTDSLSALAEYQRVRGGKARTMQHLSRIYDGIFQPDFRMAAGIRDQIMRWVPNGLAGAAYRFLLGMA
jgi:2-polyprenyl-6-methoxyphenol hydroxylase-like FAD-dependent oxidoreductase